MGLFSAQRCCQQSLHELQEYKTVSLFSICSLLTVTNMTNQMQNEITNLIMRQAGLSSVYFDKMASSLPVLPPSAFDTFDTEKPFTSIKLWQWPNFMYQNILVQGQIGCVISL